jgi:hypothetical protein
MGTALRYGSGQEVAVVISLQNRAISATAAAV